MKDAMWILWQVVDFSTICTIIWPEQMPEIWNVFSRSMCWGRKQKTDAYVSAG